MKLINAILAMALASVTAQAIQIVHGPYLQDVYATEATFVWESDKDCIGWVEIAPADASHYYAGSRQQFFDTRNGVKLTGKLHTVRITGLKPATEYRYRVYCKEVTGHKANHVYYGDVVATDVYRKKPLVFKTQDAGAGSKTSFVVLNDVHARKDFITPLLNFADFKKRDLIIYNGDMVSIMNQSEDLFRGFMDESISLFASEQCFYYVRGNHETRGQFATSFQRYFHPCQKNLYYTMRQGPVYFICMDCGEDKPDSDLEYYGITDYDNYRSQQAEWLKTLKDDPLRKGARFTVAIIHMPTVADDGQWHGPIDCYNKFCPTLNELGVDIMLCGHEHRNFYHQPGNGHNFPVLINSNKSSIECEADQTELKATVRGLDGKVINSYKLNAR